MSSRRSGVKMGSTENNVPAEPTMEKLIDQLAEAQTKARVMGGPIALKRHRDAGRIPVRERVELVLDADSWFEIGALGLPEMRSEKHVPGDAVVTGFGTIDGKPVGVIGIDATAVAGTTAPTSMRKQGRLIELAQRQGIPIVLLCDADGGRIPDVMGWRFSNLPLDFKSFLKPREGQALVPRAAAVLGPSYGDSALHASTAHFVVMVESASIALSGPSVIESAIGETVSDAELGGPAEAQESGNAHMAVASEVDAFEAISAFLSYLPSNSMLPAPVAPARPPVVDPAELTRIVPAGSRSAYNMEDVIEAIVDGDSFFPWGAGWGSSMITGFARIEGHPVGVVANQPLIRAGALDPAALTKEHDFVDLCDNFNVPLVFLHDVPGLMIGTQAERGGILRGYERLVTRIADARVPKVGVLVRKAYGGGHFAMGGRPTHPDFLFAWPSAEMGFMAPETGVLTVFRRKLMAVREEQGDAAHDALVAQLVEEWRHESEPWEAAAHLSLDDIIHPAATRQVLSRALTIAWGSHPERVAATRK
jgi:acetyl-CoA carboxylase carboxyltransferase component